MSDRIVLLKDGVIQQLGAPEDLYERPASTFVARFIGAPAMNLLAEPGRPVIRGVRPEHVAIAAPDAAPAGRQTCAGSISALEYLGADTIVTAATAAGSSLVARVAGRVGAALGDPVLLHWHERDEHQFESGSGLRLEPAARQAPVLVSATT